MRITEKIIWGEPRIRTLHRIFNDANDSISYVVGHDGVEAIIDKCQHFPDAMHYEFWVLKDGKIAHRIIGGSIDIGMFD
jgi:hypothetical protein